VPTSKYCDFYNIDIINSAFLARFPLPCAQHVYAFRAFALITHNVWVNYHDALAVHYFRLFCVSRFAVYQDGRYRIDSVKNPTVKLQSRLNQDSGIYNEMSHFEPSHELNKIFKGTVRLSRVEVKILSVKLSEIGIV
jgi:hypothetical protein